MPPTLSVDLVLYNIHRPTSGITIVDVIFSKADGAKHSGSIHLNVDKIKILTFFQYVD